jgi:hypothetical protein
MRALRWLGLAAAAGAAALALRELVPGRRGTRVEVALSPGEEEPFLGYDGMDRDTLVAWLGEAGLDRETLLRVREYEAANRGREPVLEAVAALLD